jgi:putative transposase
MHKTKKYRIYPNKSQREFLKKEFGASRYIYNWGLDTCQNAYKESKKCLTHIDLCYLLTPLKEKEETKWLCNNSAQMLQNTLGNLSKSYKSFFKSRSNFPKYKNKYNRQCVLYNRNLKHKIGYIRLPKCGWVKACNYKGEIIDGTLKTFSVSKTKTGKYYCSITYLAKGSSKQENYNYPIIGIDLGCTDYVVTSSGDKIKPINAIKKYENRLAKEQRKLARKTKGSNRYKKQKLKVSKIYEKISNIRTDFIHKLTSSLVGSENQVFAIENLCVSDMIKNKKLAKTIADKSFYKFKCMMAYKCEWSGKKLIVCDRYFPSTKLCSCCGHKNNDLTLKDRKWVCPKCEVEHDRDINAAINLKQEAKRIMVEGKPINKRSRSDKTNTA